MKELEHEADLLAAQPRQRVLVEPRDVDAVDEHRARRRRVEAGDEAEQRRLAAARRPDDRHELTARNVEGQRMKNRERLVAALDGLRDLTQLNHDPGTPVAASRHRWQPRQRSQHDRLEDLPHRVRDDAVPFGGRMNAVALIQAVDAGHALQQKRHERHVVFLRQRGIHVVKRLRVLVAPVRRRLHPGENHRDAAAPARAR